MAWVRLRNLINISFFIGRALAIKKIYAERAQVGRTWYDAGDIEITVEWFQRDVSGGDERRIF